MNDVNEAAKIVLSKPTISNKYGNAAQEVARAYLALTDETPLDEAWLRSVGFEWCAPNGLRLNCMEWHAKWDFRINQYPYPRAPKTRGTIRLLARALGITLTEAKQ